MKKLFLGVFVAVAAITTASADTILKGDGLIGEAGNGYVTVTCVSDGLCGIHNGNRIDVFVGNEVVSGIIIQVNGTETDNGDGTSTLNGSILFAPDAE